LTFGRVKSARRPHVSQASRKRLAGEYLALAPVDVADRPGH
jgi:hypothetical protein